jgi:tRNA pseudouridine38-40 synthase
MSIDESGPFRHYALRLAYEGSAFGGFQAQPGRETVQSAIEGALRQFLGKPIHVHGASRTDAGVHARAQVVSFKVRADLDVAALARAANAMCAPILRVTAAVRCQTRFHARWCATGKTYRYRFGPAPEAGPPAVTPIGHSRLLHGACLKVDDSLVLGALSRFPGEGHYQGVCGRGPAKLRVITRAEGRRLGQDEWEMWFVGTSFGRFMVRNLAGLAIACGMGIFPLEAVSSAIASDRQLRGLRAPAQGLTLWSVHYPAGLMPFDPHDDGNVDQ